MRSAECEVRSAKCEGRRAKGEGRGAKYYAPGPRVALLSRVTTLVTSTARATSLRYSSSLSSPASRAKWVWLRTSAADPMAMLRYRRNSALPTRPNPSAMFAMTDAAAARNWLRRRRSSRHSGEAVRWATAWPSCRAFCQAMRSSKRVAAGTSDDVGSGPEGLHHLTALRCVTMRPRCPRVRPSPFARDTFALSTSHSALCT